MRSRAVSYTHLDVYKRQACMNGREDKCGGHEYMQKLIAAIDDSELIVFCAPTYVYHIPGQVKTLLDHFAYRWLVHRPDLSLMCKQEMCIRDRISPPTAGLPPRSTRACRRSSRT